MPFLVHVGFDNDRRLNGQVHYFNYEGVDFKLVQNNPRKYQDVLLSVVQESNPQNLHIVYQSASRFLSALAWENNSQIRLGYLACCGFSDQLKLRNAKCLNFQVPRIYNLGNVTGHNIHSLPKVETKEQRVALSLFAEARSCNSPYLAFLFFWQILGLYSTDPSNWTTSIWKKRYKNGFYLDDYLFRFLGTNGEDLGSYLNMNFRHAVAHIKRNSGEEELRFDDLQSSGRFNVAVRIVEQLARHYIKNHLCLTGHVFLGQGAPLREFPPKYR